MVTMGPQDIFHRRITHFLYVQFIIQARYERAQAAEAGSELSSPKKSAIDSIKLGVVYVVIDVDSKGRGRADPLDESKVFETYFELPDGYQVQMMVLRDYPGGKPKRGLKMSIYRSRVWIGHEAEGEPIVYRSQEHQDLRLAIDACYSTALSTSRSSINSPAALEKLQERIHSYFSGASRPNVS